MGRSRNATPTKSASSKAAGGRTAKIYPLDVSSSGTESGKAVHTKTSSKASPQTPSSSPPTGVDSPQDSDRRGSKDVFPSPGADSTSKAANSHGGSGRPPHGDSGMFTQQLQRLRARLQSVVQGVREVAQSLDEPHTLIANVRDQLQNRSEASLRRSSLSSVPSVYAGAGPTLSRNSSLSRNSTGGIAALKGVVPEAHDPEADVPASPYETPSGSGAPGSSVRARVAAVERRSRSSGGLAEATPVLPASALPIVPESGSAQDAPDGECGVAEGEQEHGAGPSVSQAEIDPNSSPLQPDVAPARTSLLERISRAGAQEPANTSAPVKAHSSAQTEACAAGEVHAAAEAQPGPISPVQSGGLDAAASGPGADIPATMRELWTLRARVRTQEDELAAMVKQLSTKNAQLDQAQTTVQLKDKELSDLTRRLSGVLLKLQSAQGNPQQELQLLQALQVLQQQISSVMLAADQQAGLSTPPPGSSGSRLEAAGEVADGQQGVTPPAPFSVAAQRASLLANIPEGDGVMIYQGGSGVEGSAVMQSPWGGAVGLQAPAPSLATSTADELAGRVSSNPRHTSTGLPNRMQSLRDTGTSLEVSLPPPPNVWSQSGAGEDEEEDGRMESVQEGQENRFASVGPTAENGLPSELPTTGDQAAVPTHRAVPVAPGRDFLLSGMDVESCSSSVNSASLPVLPAPTVPAARLPIPAGRDEAAARATAVGHTGGHDNTDRDVREPASTDAGTDIKPVADRPLTVSAAAAVATGRSLVSAQLRRRRGLLGHLLHAVPTAVCVALLLCDPQVRERLEQLKRLAKNSSGRRSSPTRRRAAMLVAAARAAPLDVSPYMPQVGATAAGAAEEFESQAVRECKTKWCSIIRPPSGPAVLYY